MNALEQFHHCLITQPRMVSAEIPAVVAVDWRTWQVIAQELVDLQLGNPHFENEVLKKCARAVNAKEMRKALKGHDQISLYGFNIKVVDEVFRV